MATEDTRAKRQPSAPDHDDDLEQVLAELREANERLVTAGVRMQELADEAQRARDEAEAANHAKDEFLAVLSHELRTPLNAILGWTHMLRHTALTGPAADRALDIIERNAKLQSQIIADLLQVSQIISGKLRLEIEAVDLASLLSAGIDALRPAASGKAITLESHIEPDVPPVLADAARVQQVIWNVLSNAIKFTSREGHIDLTLKQDGSAAEISIKDDGVGIEPDLLPHVFERFRQGDGSSQRVFGGLGLGLAIVRQLMELHGGTARGESAGTGCGSTFTLRFPIPAFAPSRARIGRFDRTSALRGLRVLVVEDDPDSRELMVALLSGNGAEVTAVASAREAVAQVRGHIPDLMIADIGLPNQDGYELIRQVRSHENPGHEMTPAVALTAYARPQDRDRALAAGFQLHIAKPVDPEAFVNTIAELARRFRDRRGAATSDLTPSPSPRSDK
jgi:signal transduction histidine kinase/AmiR/NasT family two-component response regulator